LRTRKVDSAGTSHYVTDGVTPGSDVLKDGSAVYTPGVSERRGTTSKYFQGDHLGSTRAITNSSQTQTDTWIYDAFGRVMTRTGTSVAPFQFAGGWQYQSDADSGLMLLGHRYYDSETGRFISCDPAKHGDNWYTYCENNPLGWVDPKGLVADEVLPVIRRLIAKRKLPGGTARYYQKNPDWAAKIHDEIGDENFRDGSGRRRKQLPDEEILDIISRLLPDHLRPPPDEDQEPPVEYRIDWRMVGTGLVVIGVVGLIILQPEIGIPLAGGAILRTQH
jgi:RHS repeat-associated protein